MSLFERWFGKGSDAPRDEAEATVEASQLSSAALRTRRGFFQQISQLFGGSVLTDDIWDDLEALLVQADVGVETATYLVNRTKDRVKRNGVRDPHEVRRMLHAEMVRVLQAQQAHSPSETHSPHVILVVGVNGAGKTTLIAKLAHRYKMRNQRVVLAAGDTFRAAATEQLETWAERVGVPVITRGQGADPGAVVYDAMEAATTTACDVLIIDTAGRLHAKTNLMQELTKIRNIITRKIAGAPHEVLLVIDATTGQNGVLQAKAFAAAAGVTGVVITKMDGTAKGGIAFAVAQDIQRPVRYVGTGEKMTDLALFDAETFVDALFAHDA
ncbi:MAG: signal recognition particle-docking protein FtsY [Roseiflexaceae bacterium]|jgi:fused signal recognition particle receptor|nr:signal recognition particle-docking protein FtsY [Chloroflexaceae bacterium]MCE2851805.1 signal recognition particle-docking protein FtsY [Chloroflexaceae bacterium]